ncbi:RRNAD-like protein, partial [Mya arenaria]
TFTLKIIGIDYQANGNRKYSPLREDELTPSAVLHPTESGGQLHAYFRKHVKPKKQHEITNLGKVIYELSREIGCDHVVDVGSGLGHLARLLAFGFGLNVTSVEAADTHAPKATKYDREIDREMKKKMELTGSVAPMPHHVTSMIYPHMGTQQFMQVLAGPSKEWNQSTITSLTGSILESTCNSAEKSSTFMQGVQAESDKTEKQCVQNSDTDRMMGKSGDQANKRHSGEDFECEINTKTLKSKHQVICYPEISTQNQNIDQICSYEHSHNRSSEQMSKEADENSDCKDEENVIINQNEKSSVKDCEQQAQSSLGNNGEKARFILTGLHACGDLTATFLSTRANDLGYPMSEYVASLPDHQQSYASRELACHFADTYYNRLKANSPHLMIHSYRAALEWLANQLSPGFLRTAVQIPAKKTNNMDFNSYVRLGLEKLCIPTSDLTDEMLETAKKMNGHWKDVVAFYTIRLALAPVVESLVLLDRMMFLYEKDHRQPPKPMTVKAIIANEVCDY